MQVGEPILFVVDLLEDDVAVGGAIGSRARVRLGQRGGEGVCVEVVSQRHLWRVFFPCRDFDQSDGVQSTGQIHRRVVVRRDHRERLHRGGVAVSWTVPCCCWGDTIRVVSRDTHWRWTLRRIQPMQEILTQPVLLLL